MATVSETLAIAEAHLQAGRLPEAEAMFQEILTIEPHQATCLHGLGLIAFQRLDWAKAVDLLERAVHYNPDNAGAHAHLAVALQNSARPYEALEHLVRALASCPDAPEAHQYMGLTLRAQGRLEEAAEHYRRALDLQHDYPEAHAALGVVLTDQGRPAEAIAHFEQALSLRPDYVDAHLNYGTALTQEGRFDEAVVCFQRVLALKPDHVDALLRLSRVFCTLLRREDALESLERALKVKPVSPLVRIGLCMAQLPILYNDVAEIAQCRARYEECLTRLCSDFDDGHVEGDLATAVASSQPFYLAYQGYNDRELQRAYGTLMCRAVTKSYPDMQLPAPPRPGEKVRVGIVAGLFRDHTVWKLLIKAWLTQLDREKFELFGYHTAAPPDGATELARKLCDRFVQGPLPVERWREEIAKDAPHVLIYPDIGMDPGAGQLGAHRLAPVQCVTFGHPNTTGYPTIDYFLSSAMMEAADGDEHYTERLIRLPNLGLYYEPLEIPEIVIERSQMGLREDAVVFWSGQSLVKYLPQYDEIYARIARKVGNCQFVFIRFHAGPRVTEVFQQRLDRAFAAVGLKAADHCVFLPWLPTAVFITAIGKCDIVLDPPTWSGGNTTLEGLANDVPIVTWPSPLMRGRATMAVLERMGITETIAETSDDYVRIAVRLAKDVPWRMSLKQRMAENKRRVYRDREYVTALEDFLWRAAHAT